MAMSVDVTPRMHGIHHSIIMEETDANWSTIFSFPDFVHRTIRLNVPQQKLIMGLPVIRSENELTFGKLIPMPIAAGHPAAQRPMELMRREEPLELRNTVLADGWNDRPAAQRRVLERAKGEYASSSARMTNEH